MFLWKACSFWLALTVVDTNLKCCLIIWNNFTCFCSFRSKMTSFEHPYKWNFKRKSSLLGMLKMCYFRSRWTNTFKDIRPAYKNYMKRSMLTMQNVRVKSEQDWPIWGSSPTRSTVCLLLLSRFLPLVCVTTKKLQPVNLFSNHVVYLKQSGILQISSSDMHTRLALLPSPGSQT